MFRKSSYLFSFVLLLGLAAESIATDYYVATDGDDSDPGTISQPWLSIKQSCYNLQPGDTLHIRGGTYTGAGNIDIDFKYNGKHGTQASPIIIKAYLDEEVIIDAEQAANIFDLQNVDWITIDSIEFRNGLHDHIFLGYDVAANNITIKNCKFSGIDFWAGNNPAAIYINTTASDITVNNNVMIGDGTDTAGCGVIMFRAAGEIKVFNNEIYGTTNGVFVKHGNDPGCVTRVYNNYIHDVTGDGVFLNTDDGIIENNLIHNTGGTGVRIFEGMGYNGGDNNYISHNTIVNCNGGIYLQHPMDGDPGATNTQIYDNIIYYSCVSSGNRTLTIWNYYSGAVEHYTVMNRNCYYDDNYTDELLIKTDTDYYADAYTLAGWQSFSCSSYSLGCQDADSIQQNPLFVNVGADDYHLQLGSPCKGAGSGGSDMGANVDLVGTAPLLDEDAYFIDPVDGNDTTGDGSLGSPWKSFANIISYYTSSYRPPGWVDIQAGDKVYLMNGTHNTVVHPGDGSGPDGGGSYIIYLSHEYGTSSNLIRVLAYPGHSPVVDIEYSGRAVYIINCSYMEIGGIEIKNGYGRGISIPESDHITVHDMHIHDTDGRNDGNVCGLEVLGSREIEVYDSVFHDNYDRTGAQGHPENSTAMVCFNSWSSGGSVTVHDCEFYQILPMSEISGCGLKYKHACDDPNAFFHVYNNTFRNNKFFSFASGTANTHFHHNLINTGGPMRSKNEGGNTHQTNQLFEYNTVYKSKAFYFVPVIVDRNPDFPNDPTDVVFRHNITYHNSTSYDNYNGMVDVGTYIEDDLYDICVDALTFSHNCYYNPNTACKFNFAGGGWASEGGSFTFSGWQTEYGYDLDSVETDPLFIDGEADDFRLQACSPCANMGIYAGDLDGDRIIGWGDLKVICDNWLQSGPEIEGDLNNDDDVNFNDLAEFGLVW